MSYSLTREEEYEYIRRAQAGDKRAANEFVAMHYGFVKWTIAKYCSHRNEDDVDDLIAWGMVGITKALNRFDCSRGYRFSTVASHWVKNYVSRALYEMTGLSKNSDEAKIAKRRSEVVQRLNSGESANDVGKDFGLSGERVEAFLLRSETKVPYEKLSDTHFLSVHPENDIIERDENVYLSEIADRELGKLKKRNREIVERRLMGESFVDIGDSMKIGRTRAQYIFNRDFAKVQKRALKAVKSAA